MVIIKNNIIKTTVTLLTSILIFTLQSDIIVYSNALDNESLKTIEVENISKTIEAENKIIEDSKTNYTTNEEIKKDIQAIENLKQINQDSVELDNTNKSDKDNSESNMENKGLTKTSYKEIPIEEIVGSESTKALLQVDNTDINYIGKALNLSDADRNIVERLVQGEAGGEGLIGAALVAQAIRDTMISKNYSSIEELRTSMKYSGNLDKEPNEDVKKAVSLIFDKGGMAVQHNLTYFYAPKRVASAFHESQKFVVEYGGHRFFN